MLILKLFIYTNREVRLDYYVSNKIEQFISNNPPHHNLTKLKIVL